jgi:hypothetical protein
MLDSIDVANLPAGADAYAGYVDGRWATWIELKAAFPKARLLSIAVFPVDDAECLDVESGDATVADVHDWFRRQQRRKVWRPVIYTSASNLVSLLATMNANGFARSSYRIWSAHYLSGEHICAPSSCGFPEADATQWRDSAPGLHGSRVDESLLHHSFFPAPPAPPKPPLVPPDLVVHASGDDDMAMILPNGAGATLALNVPADASELQAAPDGPASLEYMLNNSGKWVEWQVDANRSPNPVALGAAKVVRVKRTDKGANLVTVNWA